MRTFYYAQIGLWWGAGWDTLIRPSKRHRWCHNSVPGCFFFDPAGICFCRAWKIPVSEALSSAPQPHLGAVVSMTTAWACFSHLLQVKGKNRAELLTMKYSSGKKLRTSGWAGTHCTPNRGGCQNPLFRIDFIWNHVCILISSFSRAGNTIHKEKIMTWGNLILWG